MKSAAEMAEMAVSAVVNGDIDPITAHIAVSRMEAAIKLYRDNEDVRRITLDELDKYGKAATFGDCRLEKAETGVRYDYSGCGDSKLAAMYETLESLKADIKEREEMLKHLQPGEAVDPNTGEILAEKVYMAPSYLSALFKKETGAEVITGGLISSQKHIDDAIAHGAICCSVSKECFWCK